MTHRLPALLLVPLLAIAAERDTPSPPTRTPSSTRVSIARIRLLDASTDRVRFAVTPTLTSPRDLTVRRLSFDGMRLNGIPVYVPPVRRRIELKGNEPFTPPDPLPVTIYLRDLDTTQPLETLLTERRLLVEGNVLVEAELPLLAKVWLRSTAARTPVRLRHEIPVDLPGGPMAHGFALSALRTAGSALERVQGTLGLASARLGWRNELMAEYRPQLLVVESRYRLENRRGEGTDLRIRGFAFRVSDTEYLMPRELAEPWRFDADSTTTLRALGYSVQAGSTDLRVWTAEAGAAPLRLRDGQFRLVLPDGAEERTLLISAADQARRKVAVHRRDSESNVALLRFEKAPNGALPGRLASQQGQEGPTWDRLAVFRLPETDGDEMPRVEIVYLEARRDGQRVVLQDPIDLGALGSPLVSAEGMVALLQEEGSALLVERALAGVR